MKSLDLGIVDVSKGQHLFSESFFCTKDRGYRSLDVADNLGIRIFWTILGGNYPSGDETPRSLGAYFSTVIVCW